MAKSFPKYKNKKGANLNYIYHSKKPLFQKEITSIYLLHWNEYALELCRNSKFYTTRNFTNQKNRKRKQR